MSVLFSKRQLRFTGILFIIPLIAYSLGNGLISDMIHAPGYIPLAGGHPQVVTGAVLMLVNSCTVVLIGIIFFSTLKNKYPATATIYLMSRVIETTLLLIGMTAYLLIISLGEKNMGTGNPDLVKTLAILLVKAGEKFYQAAMIILGLGSIPLLRVLLILEIIPRRAAVWGMAGYVLLAAGALADLYGSGVGIYFSIPGGMFEIFLGIFFLVKGFKSTAV